MLTNFLKGVTLLVLLAFGSIACSAAEAGWSANWIWNSSYGPANTWLAVRKTVNINGKPTSAVTRIAAENKYWLYVNGNLVVRDGGLDIRPSLTNTYYDEIDLAPYLKEGENLIAALVWYKGGEDGYSQKTMDHAGFLFQSELEGASPKTIVSDHSWKVTVHPAFAHTAQTQQWGAFKWVAWPVSYDAQKELNGWFAPGYDDSTWTNAEDKGVPPVLPWGSLVYRTIPFWKDYGLTSYLNNSEIPTVITSGTNLVGNLGINIQGTPYLKLDAPAGVTVHIVLNEYYSQDYITKAGEQEFECFAWQNSSGHKVTYTFSNVTAPVKVLGLKFRQTSYDSEVLGSFVSNDEALNKLWTKCKNTSRVCMRDIFYDCPNRERGQWWGDVSEQILYSFYIYDQKSELLARKAFRELMNTQKEDGSLYTTAPGDTFHLPDQNIDAVTMLWKYYIYTGDKKLLQELYPQIKKFVGYCDSTANSDGMLILQKGRGFKLWNWIDWGDNMNIVDGSANTVVNASYILLLNSAMNIADLLGQSSDKTYYQGLQSKVKEHFNEYFWNEQAKAYVFHKKGEKQSSVMDDRSSAWAVLAGMVDEAKKPGVLEALKTKYNASPYQEMYVEMAMMQLDAKEALKRMRNRHSAMINNWSSTLCEEFPDKNSNNHAWSAGPLYHLSSAVLGVRPTLAAYDEYVFSPKVGDLTEVRADIPSPKGLIKASFKSEYPKFSQSLVSPSNTVAIVAVPKNAFGKSSAVTTVKAGKTVVWKNGKPTGKVAGVNFYKEDAEFVMFKVNPGSWSFSSEFKKSKTAE